MDIQLEQSTPNDAIIKVKIIESDYQQEVQKKIKDYSKKAVLKGFRPGKVPPGLIRKMYGQGILADEVMQIANQSMVDYIKEKDLKTIGSPLLDPPKNIDWKVNKDFEFDYKIGLVEDFEYNIDSLEIKNYQVEDIDGAFEDTLKNLRQQHGQSEEVEEVGNEDMVYGMLSKKQEGVIEEENTEKNKEEEGEEDTTEEEVEDKKDSYFVLLPLSQLTESAHKLILGSKKEEKVEFPSIKEVFKKGDKGISMATGITIPEAEALQGKFEFVIEKVTRNTPAEMNEEFFKKVFGDAIKTEEEFQTKLRENVEEGLKKDAETLISKQVRKNLLDNVSITLPDDFLKEWLFVSNEGKFSQEQIAQEYDLFAENTRWTLVRNQIAKDAEIEVKKEDVEDKVKTMLTENPQMFGLSNDTDEEGKEVIIKQMLELIIGNEEQYNRMADEIFYERVTEYIKSKAKIIDEVISSDKLDEIWEELG